MSYPTSQPIEQQQQQRNQHALLYIVCIAHCTHTHTRSHIRTHNSAVHDNRFSRCLYAVFAVANAYYEHIQQENVLLFIFAIIFLRCA